MLPLSSSCIFSFPYGHPVAAQGLFLVFWPRLSFLHDLFLVFWPRLSFLHDLFLVFWPPLSFLQDLFLVFWHPLSFLQDLFLVFWPPLSFLQDLFLVFWPPLSFLLLAPLSFLQDLFLVFWPSPSIMCFRRQFLVKMCPFQLPYLRVDEGTEITNWMQAIVFHLVIQVIFSVRIQVLIPGPKAKISNVFGSSLPSTCTHYCDSVCNQSSTARFPIFSIIYLLSFLIWPLIYNRCRCRGLLLYLITLNVTQTHNR